MKDLAGREIDSRPTVATDNTSTNKFNPNGIIAVFGPCSHISDQRRIKRITRESDLYGRKFDGFIITDKYALRKADNDMLAILEYRQPELFEK